MLPEVPPFPKLPAQLLGTEGEEVVLAHMLKPSGGTEASPLLRCGEVTQRGEYPWGTTAS